MADGGRLWPALELRGELLDARRDDLLVCLDDHRPVGIEECEPHAWRVFFSEATARDLASTSLRRHFGDAIRYAPIDVRDPGWAAISQQRLKAITIGRMVVAPPWDVPEEPPDGHRVVVIEPSTGFGTGHHASTRLCLRALQRLSIQDRRVLDVGTGSGLLAIAACLLGAAEVTGLDWDPDAIASARANVARNPGTEGLRLICGDVRDVRGDRADVVLANLNAALLEAGMDRILGFLDPKRGRAILGGFTVDDELAIRAAVGDAGDIVDRSAEDEWVTFILRVRR